LAASPYWCIQDRCIQAIAALLALALAPRSATAQTRNIGPGIPDRPATAWPRGGEDAFQTGAVLQTKLELDLFGRRPGADPGRRPGADPGRRPGADPGRRPGADPGRRPGDDRTRSAFATGSNETLVAGWVLLPYGFALHGVARLEPPPRAEATVNAGLRDHAAWLDELYLSWSRGSIDVFGGRIHPRFGFAWDRGPGLFGADFGRDYELREKLGAGARLWLSDLAGVSGAIGQHTLQLETFQADTGTLSGSLFARRWTGIEPGAEPVTATSGQDDPSTGRPAGTGRLFWRNRRAFGGPDNARGLAGTVVSLGGFDVPTPIGRLGYGLAWSRREAGEDAREAGRATPEHGLAAGVFMTVPLPVAGAVLAPIAEYVRQTAAGGFRGRRAEWLTAGFALRRPPWTLAYAWMGSSEAEPGAGRDNRTQRTASLTLDLGILAPAADLLQGLSLTLGWRQPRDATGQVDDFGLALAWGYQF